MQKLKLLFSFCTLVIFALALGADDLNQTSQIKSKLLYAKYKSYPKIVYTKQRFEVTIQINVLLPFEDDFTISTNFSDIQNIEKLTTDITWYKKTDTIYETILEYKVDNKSFLLPVIDISLYDVNNSMLDEVKIESPKIIYREIAIKQNRYSSTIASSLKINSIRTKQYTNNKLLSLISISASNSNLEEFNLASYINQGEKDLSDKDGVQTLYYFVIIPSHTQSIKFEYYNSISNEFILVELPIILEEELVSTQTDLNPYESSMQLYKKIVLAMIVFIFIMIYFFTKRGKFLFIAIFFMTFLINMMMPNEKMMIKEDVKVYILPTSNSTVYKIVEKKQEVEILQKNEKFIKILFKNKNIGWIKR